VTGLFLIGCFVAVMCLWGLISLVAWVAGKVAWRKRKDRPKQRRFKHNVRYFGTGTTMDKANKPRRSRRR